MPLDTTFAPAQVDIASGIQGLMGQIEQARIKAARKDAMQGLMQGGEFQSSVSKLMGVGDLEGVKAITGYYHALHPQLTPFQQADIIHQQHMEQLQQERVDNQKAAADEKARMGTEKLKIAQAKDKGVAKGGLDILNQQLDLFDKNADDLSKDPNLDYSVGKYYNRANRATAQFINPGVQNFWNKFDSLTSQARGNILGLMKQQGGKGQTGLGRVLLQEWVNFGNIIAPLQLSNDPAQMRKSLKTVRDFIKGSRERIQEAYDTQYGGGEAPSSEATDLPKSGVNMSTEGVTQAPAGSGNIAKMRSDTDARMQKLKDAPDGSTATDNDPSSPTYGDKIVKKGGQWFDTKTGQKVKGL